MFRTRRMHSHEWLLAARLILASKLAPAFRSSIVSNHRDGDNLLASHVAWNLFNNIGFS